MHSETESRSEEGVPVRALLAFALAGAALVGLAIAVGIATAVV